MNKILEQIKLWYEPLKSDRKAPIFIAESYQLRREPAYFYYWVKPYIIRLSGSASSKKPTNIKLAAIKLGSLLDRGLLSFYKWAEKDPQDRDFTKLKAFLRWFTTPLFLILFILANAGLYLKPQHIVYADPMLLVKPVLPVAALPQTALQPLAAVAAIEQPKAEIVASTQATEQTTASGCTTYHSGDLYLDKIIAYESTYNSCAENAGGCFGLLQACPGAPLKIACGGNPTCQIQWFMDNKTGGRSWVQVWQHELDFGWW